MITKMIANASYTGRLAPAPTGALHLGNARTFLIAWLRARLSGGRLILRLEDLDHPKTKPHAAAQAYEDLHWLGLDWDAGPPDSAPTETADPMYIQSNRHERYAEVMRELWRQNRLYPCVCTRKELASCLSAPNAGEDAHERRYAGTCRGRFASIEEAEQSTAREPGIRFRVDDENDDEATSFTDAFAGPQRAELDKWSGDFLIGRGRLAGYQLAVVIDDHDMNVTEVVRGDDLLPSTHRQLAIYRALGWTPPTFFHLPLVVGADGRRLAKRHGDSRLSVVREKGRGPECVLGWLAFSCGWIEKLRETSLAEICEKCDFSQIPHAPAVVSEADLRWMGFL